MHPFRVLIVEDHEGTRKALRGIFLRRGYCVDTATTVAEALERLDPAPSCIVLDLMLPDGKGETILEKVRQENLPSRVAVCTGSLDSSRLAAVQRLKPQALLHKPVDFNELCRACDCPTR